MDFLHFPLLQVLQFKSILILLVHGFFFQSFSQKHLQFPKPLMSLSTSWHTGAFPIPKLDNKQLQTAWMSSGHRCKNTAWRGRRAVFWAEHFLVSRLWSLHTLPLQPRQPKCQLHTEHSVQAKPCYEVQLKIFHREINRCTHSKGWNTVMVTLKLLIY